MVRDRLEEEPRVELAVDDDGRVLPDRVVEDDDEAVDVVAAEPEKVSVVLLERELEKAKRVRTTAGSP